MLKTFISIFLSAETFMKPVSDYTDYKETAEPKFYYPRKKQFVTTQVRKTYAISLIHKWKISEKGSKKSTTHKTELKLENCFQNGKEKHQNKKNYIEQKQY